jgi:hypothetical protein
MQEWIYLKCSKSPPMTGCLLPVLYCEFFAPDHGADGVVRGKIKGSSVEVAPLQHLLFFLPAFAF